MNKTVVYIGTAKTNSRTLRGFFVNKKTASYMAELFYPVTVCFGTARPAFPTKEQEAYLSSVGIRRDDCPSCAYRMFISGVTKPMDYLDGAELPEAALGSYGEFRSQVLRRIRKTVGTPDDN